ncbi:hypothetical protein G7059_09785 [Erysipelothrix sp. HDW6A]|uniref:hypothetical protein n=1 Tax=Erysipelothrix sp. HDW6A TaxID=2714928 RepID=UPI0014090F3C|nr:hypothetical protein [Erysipelothrix sp. HDW6A]QIK58113.1 hypothetical protein G7059_09785 [Erysipelothrix sp. HDW6A]
MFKLTTPTLLIQNLYNLFVSAVTSEVSYMINIGTLLFGLAGIIISTVYILKLKKSKIQVYKFLYISMILSVLLTLNSSVQVLYFTWR